MPKKQIDLYRYIEKAKPFISKQRFSQLKIDELVKHMDISKATFYKYFTTKEDVLDLFIDGCINYLDHSASIIVNEDSPITKRFQKTYEQSLKSVIYVSDELLMDLGEKYPHHFSKLNVAQQKRNTHLQTFFQEGIKKGQFRPINTTLFMLQDEAVIRKIMHPSFSIQYDITVKNALFDFYLLKKYQLLEPSILNSIQDTDIENQISNILLSYYK
jgi:AcrR family transcriptional regulator